MRAMCAVLYPAELNIDYYPTNFVPRGETLYYIDYECNAYMEQWDFEHWARSTGQSRRPRRIEQLARRETGGQNFFQNPIDNPGMCCYINSNDNHY